VLVMLMHVFRKSIFKEVSFPFAAYVYLTEGLIPRCYKNNLFAVLSPSSKRDMQAFGIRDEQMTVIPPGTDTQRFRPDLARKGGNFIVHVGRLKRYKSTDHLLQATKLLTERGWGKDGNKDLKVAIVGDGDDVPRLKEMTSQLGLDRLVEFTGFIPEEKKVEYYQQAAVLVENSVKEGWGLIVMEANACGTPVVAARSPGLVDSVNDGETGFLYEYGNVPELADKIERLLTDSRLRTEMGQKGIAWADKYSWDNAADAMLTMIDKTIHHQGTSTTESNTKDTTKE
jgi:glycosyltransferase involved in cell wall biosynthesis